MGTSAVRARVQGDAGITLIHGPGFGRRHQPFSNAGPARRRIDHDRLNDGLWRFFEGRTALDVNQPMNAAALFTDESHISRRRQEFFEAPLQFVLRHVVTKLAEQVGECR